MSEITMQEMDVVTYLREHPDFFEKHQELLDDLTIYHQSRGNISLVDMKLQRQHQQLAQQREEFERLSQMAMHNEKMFFSLLPLQQKFSQSTTFAEGMAVLQDWTVNLGLKKGRVLLCHDSWQENENVPDDYWLDCRAFDMIRLERFGLQRYYLGKITNKEKTLLFLQQDFPLGSVALCLLGKELGSAPYTAVLQFSALDERHFHRDQETTFLLQLADLIEEHLERWVVRK